MIPLYDENAPKLSPPYLVLGLIGLNIFIFLASLFGAGLSEVIEIYGMIPADIFQWQRLTTLFSSMFIHAGILHLISNLWFLWLFGDNIEHKIGILRFLLFYFLAGLIAGIAHLFFVPMEFYDIPMVGASGAISGLLGAYLILFPRNRIYTIIIFVFTPLLVPLPAYIYIGLWFFFQLFFMGTLSGIAYEAHIGGFIAGMLLAFVFQSGKLKTRHNLR